jgi:hypothetical protein
LGIAPFAGSNFCHFSGFNRYAGSNFGHLSGIVGYAESDFLAKNYTGWMGTAFFLNRHVEMFSF